MATGSKKKNDKVLKIYLEAIAMKKLYQEKYVVK
jgi:hypothetical protein